MPGFPMHHFFASALFVAVIVSVSSAAEKQCETDGFSLFVRDGMEARLKPTEGLVFAVSEKLRDGYMLKRWDGVLGTFDTHLDWMYQHAREHTDPAKDGFRPYGEHSGIIYEIHDELTKAGGGDGYFRLSGEIDVPPEALVAQVMDATALGELDPTVMYMHFLHRYNSDPRSRICLWIAAPGFPFEWRMVRCVCCCYAHCV